MDDDLRDLLDPGEDPRVAAALRRIQADLLVAPDEVTAARHRRQRRQLRRRPTARPVRRTAVAVLVAVVGTGAILSATAPTPVVPGAPAGDEQEPVDARRTTGQVGPIVPFPRRTAPSDPELPSFGDRLPAPTSERVPRGGEQGRVPAEAPDTDAPPSPASAPGPAPDHGSAGPPGDRPGPAARPSEPGPPARTPARRRPASPPAPAAPPVADAATPPDHGDRGAPAASSRPPTDEGRAGDARGGGAATPGADGGR